MRSNGRYAEIKPLLESKTIKKYSDIFTVAVTKTIVARDLKININHFTKMIASPANFKMRKIIRQGELFDLTLNQMIELIEKESSGKKESIDHEKKDSRYRKIKTMLRIGRIKRFVDIFAFVPKYIVARDINKGRSRWGNYGNYTFGQVRKLAELCELPFMEMYQLITHP